MNAPSSSPEFQLPAEFADLEPFASWALETETARNRKRHETDFTAIVAFRDAMMANIDRVIAYLDRHPLDDLPADAEKLLFMLLSLAEVAPAVEFYRQPAVIDGFDPRRFVAQEDFILRPRY